MTAAIAPADTEGLDAVSMPRLARTLGAAPMSLHRHVPSKDALVDLMLDTAIGPPPPTTGGGWRASLAAWAHANRAVLARHPWTLPLVTGSRPMGPHARAWGESALLEPLLRAAQDAPPGGMHDDDFTFGLDRVLDGVERYVTGR